jgi:hypothetical protein
MRIVQLKRRPTPKVDSMMVLRARRGRTGSKYVTLRGGRRRAIPFLLVRSGWCARSWNFYADKRKNGLACLCIAWREGGAYRLDVAHFMTTHRDGCGWRQADQKAVIVS